MEIGVSAAKARLSELVAAARRGARIVITKYGKRVVELVACKRRGGGFDFEKLEATRRRLGIVGDGEGWPEEFNDPAFSRQVLGLEDD